MLDRLFNIMNTHNRNKSSENKNIPMYSMCLVRTRMHKHKFVITHKSAEECNADLKLKTRSTPRNYT